MIKIAYIDLETTGTIPGKHAVVEIAGILEVEGEVKDEFSFQVKPFPQDWIDDKALEVNGLTRTEIDAFTPPDVVYKELVARLGRHVDKYCKGDKFHFVGYNANFDSDHLRAWFGKCGDRYFGSWFWWPSIDVAVLASAIDLDARPGFDNFRLGTVAAKFGVDIPDTLHRGSVDIAVTRELFQKVWGRVKA